MLKVYPTGAPKAFSAEAMVAMCNNGASIATIEAFAAFIKTGIL